MDPSPLAGHTAGTSQHAVIYGRNNVIVQIQGDGNTVAPSLPHLTLTRYTNRRQQAPTEVRLLSPYAMTIPLIGRKPELADLKTWLAHEKPISIRVLTGRAGSGKTRLALELCDQAVTKGWDAGFVTDAELERFFQQQNLSEWGWQHPTLIVIDYAAARSHILAKWFVELADHLGDSQKPLRLLLLERHADPSGGWWQEAFGRGGWDTEAVRDLLDPPDGPVDLLPLIASEERYQILRAMLEKTNSTVRPPEPGPHTDFGQRLDRLSWGGEPLFLMMTGLMAARIGFGNVLTLSRGDLAFRLADREINRIEEIARGHRIREGFLSHMAAYVTLCQGLTRTCSALITSERILDNIAILDSN